MKRIIAGFLVTLALPQFVCAQAVRGGGNPYSSQLMTDPDAGTVQGIQRYGNPMAADPAQGNSYPYFVFPSVRNKDQSAPFLGSPTVNLSPSQQLQVQRQIQSLNSISTRRAELIKSIDQKIKTAGLTNSNAKIELSPQERNELFEIVRSASTSPIPTNITPSSSPPISPTSLSPQLFNEFTALSLAGAAPLTLDAAQKALSALQALPEPSVQLSNAYATLAAPVFVPARGASAPGSSFQTSIEHQPLIQIKLRVVEVIRDDTTNSGSSLDYIRKRGTPTEFVKGAVPNVNNIPGNAATAASRFGTSGFINVPSDVTNLSGITGAGALVNITSKHMNWIASLLATELEAEVLTAPELVTTNGEGVEFVAGSKEPFNLGSVDPTPAILQTTLTATESPNRKNSVFYKHVGTYLKITPRIVNYAGGGKGRGESPIVADDVRDWNLLIRFLLNEHLELKNSQISSAPTAPKDSDPHVWEPYTRSGRLVPLEVKTQVLECVNRFTKSDLRNYTLQRGNQAGFEFNFLDMLQNCEAGDCGWRPEDCTIDIEVVARFSQKGNDTSNANLPAGNVTAGTDLPSGLTVESDVRAIANILQIKNGTGLVMAGLLGESDIESVAKIPVIGDLPVVGYLFRSKSVSRKKSEILIFIEANILSDNAQVARAESGADLQLAKPYVSGETLDNPLEIGLQRAGFGNYLPPASLEERMYWAKRGQNINRIRTEVSDALR